jgi:hypothetical protein
MFGGVAAPSRPYSRVQLSRVFSDYDGFPAGKVEDSLYLPLKAGAVSGTVYGAASTSGAIVGRGNVDATVTGQAATSGGIGGLYAINGSAQGLATTSGAIRGRGHVGATLSIGSRPTAEEINNALLDTQFVEPGMTLRQAMRLLTAVLGGKISGLTSTGGTAAIRDTSDSKNRVTATVDANGNRTSVTRDLT